MTLTISVSPRVENALTSRASAAGVQIDRFVEDLLEREFTTKQPTGMSDAEIASYLAEFRSLSSHVSHVNDPNFTRETIYQDHD